MELKIYNPSEDGFIKNIEWNYKELKAEISNAIEPYKNLVLTDDQIQYGKKEVAKLRKFVGAFETERKRIKAQCTEPYDKFKKQYDDVLKDVNSAINFIDGQIKEFEKNRKAEKLLKVKEIYEEIVPEGMRSILTFENLDRDRFCLQSTPLKSIKDDIQQLLSRVYSDVSVIQHSEKYVFEMMECYKQTLDLNAAIRKGQELQSAEERKAAYEAKRQAEVEAYKKQQQAEAEMLARANDGFVEVSNAAGNDYPVSEKNCDSEPTYIVGLNVHGTRKQLDEFCRFLNEKGIRYDITLKPQKEEN